MSSVLSDKEKIQNSVKVTDSLALLVEEMFNSKQMDVPEELKILSSPEINSIFFQALLNITDKEPERFKLESGELEEFNKLAHHVKLQLYSDRDSLTLLQSGDSSSLRI